MSNEARDHEEVICPNCTHQFRAISDADQTHIADLQQQVSIVYEGYDVYQQLTERAKKRTTHVNVLDTLDSLRMLMKLASL